MSRRRLARFAAPAAFLAVVTIAALVVHSGLHNGSSPPATSTGTTRTSTTKTHHDTGHRRVHVYVVKSGDTFGSIAQKTGTSVAQLEHLNPKVDPTALQVGERIRVR